MKLNMSIRHWTPIALALGCLTPAILHAQTSTLSPAAAPVDAYPIGGKLSVDMVMIKADALGVPLRHGAIMPGSEEVQLNGHRLKSGADYTMDNDAGMVYL